MEHIITAREELRKRFHENGFAFLSSAPRRYVQERNSSKKRCLLALLSSARETGIRLQTARCDCKHRQSCTLLQSTCYYPEHGSKVNITLNAIDALSEAEYSVYVLMDGWYTNAQVWNKCITKKCHLTGAMKSNRILYPNGIRISARVYVATRTQGQFHLVTMKGQEYFVHRYDCPLSKLKRAVVLLTYPKEKFEVCNTLKVFLL